MTPTLTQNARRQHVTRDEAERAIEIYYPAGYLYFVTPHKVVAGDQTFHTFTVQAFSDEGKFLGYCYDAIEAKEAGSC